MTTNEDSPHDEGLHNAVPVTSAMSSNYFPSRLPGEVRNTIYEHVMNNARPFPSPPKYLSCEQYEREYEIFLSSKRTVLFSCLGLTSTNRQIRSEFGGLLMNEMHLEIPLRKFSAFFATFFPRQCLEGSCGHSGHPTRPQSIEVVLGPRQPDNAVGRNMIDVYKVKAYAPNLKIRYSMLSGKNDYSQPWHSLWHMCLSLDGMMANDTVAFLDNIRGGLIRSVVLKVSKSDSHKSCWKFGLRKSSGKLSESEKEVMCSQGKLTGRPSWGYSLEICVQNNKGKLTEEWVYCHLSQTLVRRDQYVR
ncbi:hypothetical protein E8E13_005855 [Curvularia kusanoi]|uniref:Uncharacterized protein n=1 Tax=Curvularia kusanoi TaxID=90978 RepID=A0A9P4T883_CURKU|nr:hypothetical protein E8E13_005855 [Curvularia kusanoi]